ncbi:hypothetical protein BJ878DRAFT_576338 [Calycina marina]|uniref:Uncharacterized protein n=1 Tax=Calycina marina TaxID=1763456 RepID=A0A9P8CEI1_9HELO|nr:hypothetical protein BJ878DRAFT_576338 [Calycina marina]
MRRNAPQAMSLEHFRYELASKVAKDGCGTFSIPVFCLNHNGAGVETKYTDYMILMSRMADAGITPLRTDNVPTDKSAREFAAFRGRVTAGIDFKHPLNFPVGHIGDHKRKDTDGEDVDLSSKSAKTNSADSKKTTEIGSDGKSANEPAAEPVAPIPSRPIKPAKSREQTGKASSSLQQIRSAPASTLSMSSALATPPLSTPLATPSLVSSSSVQAQKQPRRQDMLPLRIPLPLLREFSKEIPTSRFLPGLAESSFMGNSLLNREKYADCLDPEDKWVKEVAKYTDPSTAMLVPEYQVHLAGWPDNDDSWQTREMLSAFETLARLDALSLLQLSMMASFSTRIRKSRG